MRHIIVPTPIRKPIVSDVVCLVITQNEPATKVTYINAVRTTLKPASAVHVRHIKSGGNTHARNAASVGDGDTCDLLSLSAATNAEIVKQNVRTCHTKGFITANG